MTGDSPHKKPVMQKAFQRRDTIMVAKNIVPINEVLNQVAED